MGLTNREQQLIALIGRGMTNKEGPLTITHPDMKRFFMMIPEAVALVLQASTIGQHGDILVPTWENRCALSTLPTD